MGNKTHMIGLDFFLLTSFYAYFITIQKRGYVFLRKVLLQTRVHVCVQFVNLALGRCNSKVELNLAPALKNFSRVHMWKHKTYQ